MSRTVSSNMFIYFWDAFLIPGLMQDELQQFIHTNQNMSHTAEVGLNRAITTSVEKIQNAKQQLVYTGERAKEIVQSLNLEIARQLDLFHKVGSSAEFVPLIRVPRCQYIDRDELKFAVIRAIDIMITRLNSIVNSDIKNKLEHVRDSLQSECLRFR